MIKSARLFSSLLIAALFAALFLGAARADDEPETATIRFSDPAKPGTLKLAVSNGSLRIRGAEAAEITIRTDLKPDKPAQRKDGLRVLTSSSSYSLSEKDNVVTLSYGDAWPTGGSGDFDITVPRSTNIVVSNALGGDIEVGDVAGTIEIKSLNGEVKLDRVVNSALVETMNGEIHADVQAMSDGKPVSFTSMNGEVKLTLNPTIKANVRLRTHNGSILTDFDDKQLVTKTAALKAEVRYGKHSNNSDSDDMRAAMREAVRAGAEAAREATRAAREAMREAARAAREANGNNNDNDQDSEDAADAVAPAAPMPPVPALPPMTGGKIVSGTLNGGGPELRISTMNGDVTLRKSEATK